MDEIITLLDSTEGVSTLLVGGGVVAAVYWLAVGSRSVAKFFGKIPAPKDTGEFRSRSTKQQSVNPVDEYMTGRPTALGGESANTGTEKGVQTQGHYDQDLISWERIG